MREMKDSGIYCIGIIPKNWMTLKVLYVLAMPITDGPHTTPTLYDSGIPFVSAEAVTSGHIDFNHIRGFISESFYKECCKKYIPRRDDIYMVKSGATTGNVAKVETDDIFTIWSPLAVLRADENIILAQFLYYSIVSSSFGEQVMKNWSFGTQQNIGMRTIEKLKICLPPKEEQSRIACFLDNKCSEINSIVSAIQTQIETLEQYKKSVITEAVTKGLDSNVVMKDSGVNWIGKIPETWNLVKITNLLDYSHPYALGDGDHGLVKANDYVDEGIPYLRVQNLGWCTDLNLESVKYITEKMNDSIKNSTLRPGDVLFAKTGATIGKTAIIPDSLPISNTTSHVGKITVSATYNPRYVYYFLSSTIGYNQFWQIAGMKSTRPELSIDEITRMKIIIPDSRETQDSIVRYLDEKCVQCDAMIIDKNKQLETLETYKKSLIYEYVTGKKEVVNEQYPQ